MKKQPKLILRENAVADLTRHWPPGKFVEMGAGTGHMTRIFLEKGFSGACHDLGEDSRAMMRHNLEEFPQMKVVDSLDELDKSSFDYLMAFEVLEHIQEDEKVLAEWLSYLKPGGKFILSVPAHMKKFGKSDELVGHVRRYERHQVRQLLEKCGIGQIRIINYGYPITEFTRFVSNALVKNEKGYENLSPERRSILSAQKKTKVIDRALSLFSDKLIVPFVHMQRWFYDHDLGDSLVATGVKSVTGGLTPA
jgi:SAM-dependent methyltransferase